MASRRAEPSQERPQEPVAIRGPQQIGGDPLTLWKRTLECVKGRGIGLYLHFRLG
jgi:hypothetical protein